MKYFFKGASFYAVMAAFFVFDRFLKVLAFENSPDIQLIGRFLRFNYEPNYFISFSLPLPSFLLYILPAIIIAGLLIVIISLFKNKKSAESALLIMIILGAVSNYYDRLKYGFVIDYLDLKYFTVFNIADVMIVGGGIILLLKYTRTTKTAD